MFDDNRECNQQEKHYIIHYKGEKKDGGSDWITQSLERCPNTPRLQVQFLIRALRRINQ